MLKFIVLWCCILPGILALSSSASPTSESLREARQLATNWFSIATHLQNPTLYSTEWANACEYHNEELIASSDVAKGEILSLLPIHAVGLKGMGKTSKTDWVVFDADKDRDYFQPKQQELSPKKGFGSVRAAPSPSSPFRYDVPTTQNEGIDCHDIPPQISKALFCDVNPFRPLRSGWLGHLVKHTLSPLRANCQVVVIDKCLPLCALVATRSLSPGTILEVETDFSGEEVTELFLSNYRHEIEELQQYMDMAYPKKKMDKEEAPTPTSTKKEPLEFPFYDFPLGEKNPFPVEVLRTEPDILSVPNFLSEEECDRLIQKAQPHLVPCVTKNPNTGAVEQDSSRTSQNANIPQVEVPSIVQKLTKLADCTEEQLEILQVLKYVSGEYFRPHTDGFTGPVSACGFEASARLVTIFCYLNDVKEGGATRFGELDLEIAPKKGTAVIHFPTTTGFEEDSRTQHEGMVAVDEKWLLVTWVWMHPRDQDSIYAEKWLDPLDTDRI